MAPASRFVLLVLLVGAAPAAAQSTPNPPLDPAPFYRRLGACEQAPEDRSAVLNALFGYAARDRTLQARQALLPRPRPVLKVADLRYLDAPGIDQFGLKSVNLTLSVKFGNNRRDNLAVARVLLVTNCRHVPSGVSIVHAQMRNVSIQGQSARQMEMPPLALTLPGDYAITSSIVEWPEGIAPQLLTERCEAFSLERTLDEAGYRSILRSLSKGEHPDDPQFSVVDLCLARIELSPAVFEALTEVKGLQSLRLENRSIRQQDLQSIARLTGLKSLSLIHCIIEDSHLDGLKPLPALESLALSHCTLRPGALSELGMGSQLKRLEMRGGALSHADLATIREMPQLVELDLSNAPLTDKDCIRLSEARSLRRLNLSSTGITSDGIAYLGKLYELDSLDLSHTGFADAELVQAFRRLRRIGIAGTNIQPAALHLALERRVLDEITVDSRQKAECKSLFPEARIVESD
jgi:hypothetical protein